MIDWQCEHNNVRDSVPWRDSLSRWLISLRLICIQFQSHLRKDVHKMFFARSHKHRFSGSLLRSCKFSISTTSSSCRRQRDKQSIFPSSLPSSSNLSWSIPDVRSIPASYIGIRDSVSPDVFWILASLLLERLSARTFMQILVTSIKRNSPEESR